MISLSARSIGTTGGPGPKCRIYPIGYRWHPRAVKSNNPAFGDLREAVRFQVIYFNNAETGEFSHVPKQWKRVERVIPTFGRSELQQSHLENCEWLMLKILALDATGVDKCNTGYLYIDDVKIVESVWPTGLRSPPVPRPRDSTASHGQAASRARPKPSRRSAGQTLAQDEEVGGSAHRKERSTLNLRLSICATDCADSGFARRMGGTSVCSSAGKADACPPALREPGSDTYYLLPITYYLFSPRLEFDPHGSDQNSLS